MTKVNNTLDFRDEIDICTHFAEDNSEYFGAVTPPIVQTSLFSYPELGSFLEKLQAEREHYMYSRGNNPTVKILERKLAALEKGDACKCFASGMGAISATLFTLLKAGDHILFVNNIYGPALSYAQVIEKFGISHDVVFVESSEDIEQHIKANTAMIYVESPSTHNMDVLDLTKIAEIAKSKSILSVIDNTWATPLFQKPITLGIDLVIHSCTKYLSGHSDVIAGAVIGSHKLIDRIFEIGHQFNGAVLSPFDAWLIIRGLRTLPVRMLQHQHSAKAVVTFLQNHPKVAKVNHPLVYEGKKKQLVEQQLKGVSSLFSIELADSSNIDVMEEETEKIRFERLRTFANALHYFQIGVSWGGFESLVIVPNNKNNHESLDKLKISRSLVRLYLGLESPDLLIEDLRQALEKI